jgi:hypothetical protein
LAAGLSAQRFGVGEPIATEGGGEHHRHQDTGHDGQAHLAVDGHRALAPGLGLAETLLPGVEAFFLLPAAGVQKSDDTGLQRWC